MSTINSFKHYLKQLLGFQHKCSRWTNVRRKSIKFLAHLEYSSYFNKTLSNGRYPQNWELKEQISIKMMNVKRRLNCRNTSRSMKFVVLCSTCNKSVHRRSPWPTTEGNEVEESNPADNNDVIIGFGCMGDGVISSDHLVSPFGFHFPQKKNSWFRDEIMTHFPSKNFRVFL